MPKEKEVINYFKMHQKGFEKHDVFQGIVDSCVESEEFFDLIKELSKLKKNELTKLRHALK